MSRKFVRVVFWRLLFGLLDGELDLRSALQQAGTPIRERLCVAGGNDDAGEINDGAALNIDDFVLIHIHLMHCRATSRRSHAKWP